MYIYIYIVYDQRSGSNWISGRHLQALDQTEPDNLNLTALIQQLRAPNRHNPTDIINVHDYSKAYQHTKMPDKRII